MSNFTPTRTAALEALNRFVPHAGRDYTSGRNYDFGPGRHTRVSQLSPFIRHRILSEEEVLQAVLTQHSARGAEKFVQEVFWRTYWKGWLEMRPSAWTAYQSGLRRALDDVQTQGGLRSEWEAACEGETGIDCFDAWAQELVQTGYLHNHARMWFASIWIFTLRLPWELGADFFMRHLLDGDPASNTLGWRWVAGVQTPGKTYLARASNIAKYTEGRFRPEPGVLAKDAAPVDGSPRPERMAAPAPEPLATDKPSALILHEDDLSPGWLFSEGFAPVATLVMRPSTQQTPLAMSPGVLDFRREALDEARTRFAEHLGDVREDVDDVAQWARDMGAEQIVTAYAPVGPMAERLSGIGDMPVVRALRAYDARAWPFATAGFFKFKEKIPRLLGEIQRLKAA